MYTDEQRESDLFWFIDHYEEFQRELGDTFIGIKDKKVLGFYHTFEMAYDCLITRYEPGTFLIQSVTKEGKAYERLWITPLVMGWLL